MSAPGLRRRLLLAALAAATASGVLLAPGASAHDVGCARTDVAGGDWTMFGGDLQGSRTQDRETTFGPGNVSVVEALWTFDANRATGVEDNEVTGYPVVAAGCVFVGSSTGRDEQGRSRPGWVFSLNADTGEVVWRTRVPGGVYSTVAVQDGVVYAFVSRISAPTVVALDQQTGEVLWSTVVDNQLGSDAVSSPVVYDGLVWVGVSGTAAEGDEADRNAFQGSGVLLEADTGQIVAKAWSIPTQAWADGFAGGAQWGTMSVDPTTGFGYVPTGNPFNYDAEHDNTNAVLKLDLRRASSTFGQYVGSYKGDVDEFFPELSETPLCEELEELDGAFAAGIECLNLDLDFGAAPNVYTDEQGRRVVAAGQKSGVLHLIDAETMQPLAKSLLGVPSPVGGIVGSAAYDGKNLYGPHTVGGYLWSADATTGQPRWVSPVGDGVHWGPPVTHANGVLWTVDLRGFLLAYEAASGRPLLQHPMSVNVCRGGPAGRTACTQTYEDPTLSWGGVTVARNTVFASVGIGLTSAGLPSMPNGFVIAYRPFNARSALLDLVPQGRSTDRTTAAQRGAHR